MLRFVVALGLASTVVACGGPSLDVGMEVYLVEDRSSTPGYTPGSPGARLIAVSVRVLNSSGGTIPVTQANFFLEPAGGSSLVASPVTGSFSDACSGALAPGNTIDCTVGFDVPSGFRPVQIAYENAGLRATAPVSLDTPPGGDAGPGPDDDAGRPDAGPPAGPTSELDLLFMVDNSGSMTEEQASLTAELPRLVRILASGDFDEDGSVGGPGDFEPFDLHVGVITADMGTGGFTVPTCARSDFGDDGILRTQGRTDIPGCMATYPQFLAFQPASGGDPSAFATDIACVATTGTGGCGFEQQLEAILKALSPSAPTPWTRAGYTAPTFFRNTFGHGDTNNDGFVRDDSVLAIVPVTDEEDCSARDPDLFNPSSATYGATDLNLRCFAHADPALHPLSRFVDGILQLRPAANRVVYAPIAGVPVAIVPSGGAAVNWEIMVSEDPAVRDDRMEERVDPAMPSRLQPSCNVPGRGVAFPPVRIARVGRDLDAAGANVTIQSICQESFRSALTEIIRQIANAGRGG